VLTGWEILMVGNGRSRGGALVLSAAIAGFAVTALLLNSSSLLVDRGLDNALAQSGAGLTFAAGPGGPAAAATAGDEGFWLTKSEVQSAIPFANPLSIGDRITIAAGDGHERRLEVVDLKAIGNPPGAVGAHRLLLVSCRVTGQGAERSEALVRFLVEAVPQPSVAQRAKAL
jgi:hypothetical protein